MKQLQGWKKGAIIGFVIGLIGVIVFITIGSKYGASPLHSCPTWIVPESADPTQIKASCSFEYQKIFSVLLITIFIGGLLGKLTQKIKKK